MKKTLTTIALATVILFATTFANAGIIVAGVASPVNGSDNPCTETNNTGIIVAGLRGIIVAGFTGIIVAGFHEALDDRNAPQACGIIVAG